MADKAKEQDSGTDLKKGVIYVFAAFPWWSLVVVLIVLLVLLAAAAGRYEIVDAILKLVGAIVK